MAAPVAPPLRRLLAEALGVAAAAVAWTAAMLRIWSMPLRLPWDTRSDATLISTMVKNMTEGGWYLEQPRLGAPFGQHLQDFPHGGETIQLAVMKLVTVVVGDWGLAMNLYFVAGAGVLAAVTHLVLRHLRFGPVAAAVAALLFTAMPYRFAHGEMHLWRSSYYSVPLAALLLVWVASWRERFLRRPDDAAARVWHRGTLRWRRVGVACGIAAVVAATETMSTAFTMTLLAVGAVVGALRHRDPQRLVVSGAVIVVMAATFAVLSTPTLLYYAEHGRNEVAARRFTTESEWYGLKLTRLVLPEPGHRSATLSDLGERSQAHTLLRSERGQALGILGTLGFAGVAYAALTRRRGGEPTPATPPWDRAALRDSAVVNTLVALAFGTIGGFSVVLAMAGFGQVRVWNRIMLFVAFFAMVELLSRAEQVVAWLRRRQPAPPRAAFAALAGAVLAFGLWDGMPPPREPYAAIEARHASDRAFVAAIADVLPDGSAVFQLPVLDFPEVPPPGRMHDYDPLRAYLADDGSLRWSYGAVKGRPDADWQARLRDEVGPVGALPALLGLGFVGLWVDTAGYEPGPAHPGLDPAELDRIEEAVGVAPIVSPDGRFRFYDLRPFRASLDRTDAELRAEAVRLLGVEPPVGD
jgi:phosphoglycerol transferase